MKVFGFDPAEYADIYRGQEWVHIPGGIDAEFFAQLRSFTEREFSSHVVRGKAIGGTKEQALYEFPDAVDFPGHLFDVVAAVSGLRRETMTLSERHIKAYDEDAPADPVAHKDRLSSQVSVGLSIDIPEGSALGLYPVDHRETNMFNVSAALRESLAPEEQPDVILKDAREVVIHDKPGDVVMFAGSSMWHVRKNGSRVVNLYLKFNDFESDPLGEDPLTEQRRTETLAALRGPIEGLAAIPSRRLDTITQQFTRDGWRDTVQASVWDQKPVSLTADQHSLLRALNGRSPVGSLVQQLASGGRGEADVEADLRRLCERGVIDLV
jgi:hypothetical protein